MAIKFICSCGKHLRARDEMAARRSVCPACGQPVGIPSLRPTHRGTAAGPLPVEGHRPRRCAAPAALFPPDGAPAADPAHSPARASQQPRVRPEARPAARGRRPLDIGQVRLVVGRKHPRRLLRPTPWPSFFLFPIHAWPVLIGLSAGLATLTAATVQRLPDVLDHRLAPRESVVLALCLLVPLLIVSYACDVLQCALDSALAGEGDPVGWRGRCRVRAMRTCATWLVCFLAGPVVPAASSLLYWVYCGDLDLLDGLILAELGVVAIGYWLLVLLAVSQRGRLMDASPLRVAALVQRVGHRLVAGALVASAVLLAHAWLALVAAAGLHRDMAAGWLLLFACWLSGMISAAFLFRMLGGWCHRSP